MYELDYAKRYVAYRIEETDGPEGDDKVVVVGAYSKLESVKAAAKKYAAEVLDTQNIAPERLADFNQKTGAEFGAWVKVGDTAIHVEALNCLSEKVRLQLEARYGVPVADVQLIIKHTFLKEVDKYYRAPQSTAEIVDGVVERITSNPAAYLCIHPR